MEVRLYLTISLVAGMLNLFIAAWRSFMNMVYNGSLRRDIFFRKLYNRYGGALRDDTKNSCLGDYITASDIQIQLLITK